MRVRGFTQDDAHIFCTEAQIQEEVGAFIDMLQEVYKDLALMKCWLSFLLVQLNGVCGCVVGQG